MVFLIKSLFTGFYPHIYTQSVTQQDLRQSYNSLLLTFIVILSISVVAQYFLTIWMPFIGEGWKQTVAGIFTQDEVNKKNWQDWLVLGKYTKLLPDSILLIVSYLTQRCTSGDIEIFEKPLPIQGSHLEETDTESKISVFFFTFLPYSFVIYLLCAAALLNENGMTDIITIGYLLLSFYYIVYFRKLHIMAQKMLRPIRIFNIVVLIMMVAF